MEPTVAQGCGLASKSPIVEGLMLRTCAYTTIACAGDGSRATDGPISSNFRASPSRSPPRRGRPAKDGRRRHPAGASAMGYSWGSWHGGHRELGTRHDRDASVDERGLSVDGYPCPRADPRGARHGHEGPRPPVAAGTQRQALREASCGQRWHGGAHVVGVPCRAVLRVRRSFASRGLLCTA